MFAKYTSTAALSCALSLAACEGDQRGSFDSFDEVFPELRRVSFEENADDPLTEMTGLAAGPDGGFIVVDGPASRIRAFDADGRILRVIGRPGDGPGELENPTAAVYGRTGELHVVERGSPRHTVFWPGDSVSVTRLPGHYGFWLHATNDGLIVGLGTQDERFAVLSRDDSVIARFGHRNKEISETPFWIFFVQDRAAVAGDRIYVSSSFDPFIRVFSTSGDSLSVFGTAPPHWVAPSRPGVETLSAPGDQERIAEWVRGFTVVTGLAAVDDVVIVQYGRHDPLPSSRSNLVRETADIYVQGTDKIVEGITLDRRIFSDGQSVFVIEAEPPDPWTISVRRLARSRL
jgi:hypothetical protein